MLLEGLMRCLFETVQEYVKLINERGRVGSAREKDKELGAMVVLKP